MHNLKFPIVLMAAVVLSACGGGGSSGQTGSDPVPAPGESPVAVTTTGLFSEPRYRFTRMVNMDETGALVETVSRDRYLRPVDDVVYVRRTTVLGTDFPLSYDEHFVGRSREIVKPHAATANGVPGYYLLDGDDKGFTIAPYNTGGVRDVATRHVALKAVDLAGKPLADALGMDFQWSGAAPDRMKALRDSGLTFPAGSQGWLVVEDAAQQDYLYYTDWDQSDALNFTEWKSDYPGETFTNATWAGHAVVCINSGMSGCVISTGGKLYDAEPQTAPEKAADISAAGTYYLNPVAADALASGLKAAYK